MEGWELRDSECGEDGREGSDSEVGVVGLQIVAPVYVTLHLISLPVAQWDSWVSAPQSGSFTTTSHEQVVLRFSPVCLLVPPHLRLWCWIITNVICLLLSRTRPQLLFQPHVQQALRGQERPLFFQHESVLWRRGSRVGVLHKHAHLCRREA